MLLNSPFISLFPNALTVQGLFSHITTIYIRRRKKKFFFNLLGKEFLLRRKVPLCRKTPAPSPHLTPASSLASPRAHGPPTHHKSVTLERVCWGGRGGAAVERQQTKPTPANEKGDKSPSIRFVVSTNIAKQGPRWPVGPPPHGL